MGDAVGMHPGHETRVVDLNPSDGMGRHELPPESVSGYRVRQHADQTLDQPDAAVSFIDR